MGLSSLRGHDSLSVFAADIELLDSPPPPDFVPLIATGQAESQQVQPLQSLHFHLRKRGVG